MLFLSHLGLIKVSGMDAAKFLQGQITCDVREITMHQSRLGAWCDPKGRVQATFRLFQFQDYYFLQLPKSLIASMINGLKKYVVFFKASLEDASEQWLQFGMTDPTDNAKSQKYFSELPQNIDETIIEENKICIRVPDKSPRFLMICPREQAKSFEPSLKHHDAENLWQLLDIQAGIPTIYPETAGEFTPHQINYPLINGVSFMKGCYTGQEIIARTQYLGKAKQHMYRVSFTAKKTSPLNTKIYLVNTAEPQIAGTLLNIALEQANAYQALAVLQDNLITQEIALENPSGNSLRLLDLPYN